MSHPVADLDATTVTAIGAAIAAVLTAFGALFVKVVQALGEIRKNTALTTQSVQASQDARTAAAATVVATDTGNGRTIADLAKDTNRQMLALTAEVQAHHEDRTIHHKHESGGA